MKNSFEMLGDMDEEQQRAVLEEEFQRSCSVGKSSQQGRHLRDALIWIDLEMTGLDLKKDSILQIACIVTNGALSECIEGEEIAIHHSDEVLDGMNDWCKEHHGRSGLVDQVRASTVTMSEAEERVLRFIETYAERNSPIAGNSVHVDVQFLKKCMPKLASYMHYRIVDVSTIGELCKRWYPRVHKRHTKKNAHTAMSDIRESIEQLKFYRKHIFVS